MSVSSDLEKTLSSPVVTSVSGQLDFNGGAVHGADLPAHHIHGTDWLSRKLKRIGVSVEDRGIERVPEDERPHTNTFDLMLLWGSINFSITGFSIGLLGPAVFGLGLTDSSLAILFFVMFSNAFVAYLATFGPKTGLRQMSVSRYSFGWYGNKVMSFLQSLSCLGWSAVNATVGGQTLASLSNNKIPTPAGIVIISVFTWFISMVGYKWVHLYERYSWIPVCIIYFILLGEGAHHFVSVPMPSGPVEAGNILSFVIL
jgi:purine-cytosine permease-like protein